MNNQMNNMNNQMNNMNNQMRRIKLRTIMHQRKDKKNTKQQWMQ